MQVRTLSELATLTGLKPRTIQFWTSNGVLLPEEGTKHGGPGVHRQYGQTEVIIACILASISQFNIQIGRLTAIATYIRQSIEYSHWYNGIVKIAATCGFNSQEMAEHIATSQFEKHKYQYQQAVNGHGLTPDDLDDILAGSDLEKTSETIMDGLNNDLGAHLFINFNDDSISVIATSDPDYSSYYEALPTTYLAINLGKVLPKARL